MMEELNNLLNESLSPHVVSFEFDKLAKNIMEQQLVITVVPCKSYYKNEKLQELLEQKNKLWNNKQFAEAARVHQQLKHKLKELEKDDDTTIFTESSRFEKDENIITAYLDLSNPNLNLLKTLVENYGLKI